MDQNEIDRHVAEKLTPQIDERLEKSATDVQRADTMLQEISVNRVRGEFKEGQQRAQVVRKYLIHALSHVQHICDDWD